jgi:hypothetical protein
MARKSPASETAIAALLAEGCIERAASRPKLSPVTFGAWLKDPAFRDAYREARAEVLTWVIDRLVDACNQAVGMLA